MSAFSVTTPGDAASTGDSTATNVSSEGSDSPPIAWEIKPPDSSASSSPRSVGVSEVPQLGPDGQFSPVEAGRAGNEATWQWGELGPTTLAALRQMLARVTGAAIVFRILFIPTNRSLIMEGPVADSPGLWYRYDRGEGVLRIEQQIGSLSPILLAEAHLGSDNVFRDARSVAIGRLVSNGAAIDFDALPVSLSAANDNDPKLCPDPGYDQPGARPDNIAYQQYVSWLINRRTLPPGVSINLFNPADGKMVHFDDCRLSNGNMIDAKGPGYLSMLIQGETKFPWLGVEWKILGQAMDQIHASGGRPIEWHFAERGAADYVRNLFAERRIRIMVFHTPWLKAVP